MTAALTTRSIRANGATTRTATRNARRSLRRANRSRRRAMIERRICSRRSSDQKGRICDTD